MPAPVQDGSSTNVETGHDDMVHDAQMDFYGKRLATASSDRTIKIFDVNENGGYVLLDTLRGHNGPVWAVAWAHPSFGNILASCSYDGRVLVWRQQPHGSWEVQKEHTLHTASVNSISWAPHEFGPILACASSDGKISVLTFNDDGTWDASLFSAHSTGANAVSWAGAVVPGSLAANQAPDQIEGSILKRLASAGCDGLVKIWKWNEATKAWDEAEKLEGHTDWVRDVSWAPNVGLPRSYVASAGQDKKVLIHTQESSQGPWTSTELSGPFGDTVWRVSWNVSGNVLAVSAGDGNVSLWKENLKGEWENVSEVQ